MVHGMCTYWCGLHAAEHICSSKSIHREVQANSKFLPVDTCVACSADPLAREQENEQLFGDVRCTPQYYQHYTTMTPWKHDWGVGCVGWDYMLSSAHWQLVLPMRLPTDKCKEREKDFQQRESLCIVCQRETVIVCTYICIYNFSCFQRIRFVLHEELWCDILSVQGPYMN